MGAALLPGCYQPDSGDPDEAAGADDRAAASSVADRPDEPSEAAEGADELPGEIPPALGAEDDAGRVIPERKFQGAPIPVVSPYGAREWAVEAPALAGLESYDREAFVRLLTEGIARDGQPPEPPMPPLRMSAEDAGAIYDYLSGLPWD